MIRIRYTDDWLETDLSKRIIQGIDHSELVGPYLIVSPVLGPISPSELSDGALGVILMAYDKAAIGLDWIGEYFGDNCLPYILEVAKLRDGDYDIRMSVAHLFHFPEQFGQPVLIENDNTLIYSQAEFNHYYLYKGLGIMKEAGLFG